MNNQPVMDMYMFYDLEHHQDSGNVTNFDSLICTSPEKHP